MESYFDGYLPVAAGVRAAVRYEKETFFMSDTPNEKKFMREKVVKPPIDKRRAAGRILCYVLCGRFRWSCCGELCGITADSEKLWVKSSQ